MADSFWQDIKNTIYNHRAKLTLVGMVAFSTFVHSLPMMIHSKNNFLVWFYSWFYSFCHALAGGIAHPIGGTDPW